MLKVFTIVGTRPEIIRLSRIIAKLDQHCEHTLVHTGQNYDFELSEIFFRELGIRTPDFFLNAAGETAAETIGKVIIAVDKILRAKSPDAVLILGDTNSALAAIPAKRLKIPIFHMEAGNRCFDARVPEEINRKIVDHTSDINLTYSAIAREYLLREGFPPDQVIKTGSPMLEVLNHSTLGIAESQVLQRLDLQAERYFLVSSHREENVDAPDNLARFLAILRGLVGDFQFPIIVSTHPRTRKRIEASGIVSSSRIQFHAPFGFIDYVHLQQHAFAVLSDSGTITEESSILGFPAVNIRETHERPEGTEEASVIMAGLSYARVKQALGVLRDSTGGKTSMRMVRDYEAPNVSEKVLRIILGYTDFVKRRVWYEPTRD